MHLFRRGDRVQLSKLGAERSSRMPSKVGTIVKAKTDSGRPSVAVLILFDGMKRPARLHWTYVERLHPRP
jgi:hypothetical protein